MTGVYRAGWFPRGKKRRGVPEQRTVVAPAAGAITITGLPVAVVFGSLLTPAAGAITLAGHAPTVASGTILSPAVGSIAITGRVPTLSGLLSTTRVVGPGDEDEEEAPRKRPEIRRKRRVAPAAPVPAAPAAPDFSAALALFGSRLQAELLAREQAAGQAQAARQALVHQGLSAFVDAAHRAPGLPTVPPPPPPPPSPRVAAAQAMQAAHDQVRQALGRQAAIMQTITARKGFR